jgi:hypothetical protein
MIFMAKLVRRYGNSQIIEMYTTEKTDKLLAQNFNRGLVSIFFGDGHDYQASNLSFLRDPSLRAFAQDDSQSFGGQIEKKAAQPPSFHLSFHRNGLSS